MAAGTAMDHRSGTMLVRVIVKVFMVKINPNAYVRIIYVERIQNDED